MKTNSTLIASPEAIEIIEAMSEAVARMEGKIARLENLLNSISAKPDDATFDTKGCAEYLGMSEHYIRYLVCNNDIPHHKRGAKNIFIKSELDEWRKGKKTRTKQETNSLAEEHLIRNN